jgi:hypothetical protein
MVTGASSYQTMRVIVLYASRGGMSQLTTGGFVESGAGIALDLGR